MNSIVNFVTHFKDFYYDINGSTFTGAIDVIIVEQPDGTYTCSPFHVRFGKLGVLHSKEKIVDIEINGKPLDFHMKLGDSGEAFFVEKVDEDDLDNNRIDQRNLYCSPIPADTLGDEEKSPEIYSNGFSSENVLRKESHVRVNEKCDNSNVTTTNTSCTIIQIESKAKIFRAETSKTKVSEKISSLNSDFRPILIEPRIETENCILDKDIELKRSNVVINMNQNHEGECGVESQKSEEQDGEYLKSDSDLASDKVKKRKKTFVKKRGKKASEDYSTSKAEWIPLNLESGLVEPEDPEMDLRDPSSNDALHPVIDFSNLGSSSSLREFHSSTSMELAGVVRTSALNDDMHFFSDSEAGPESTQWDSRARLGSILSDSELDKQYVSEGSTEEGGEKMSWKWGELPSPPQQTKSLCLPCEKGSDLSARDHSSLHHQERRSMLSGMFSFMKKTKYIRHDPDSKDVYLADLTGEKLDPEVSALYFPHSYSVRNSVDLSTVQTAGLGSRTVSSEEIRTVEIEDGDPKNETESSVVETTDRKAAEEIEMVEIEERGLKIETETTVDETTAGKAVGEIETVEIEERNLKIETNISVDETETDGEVAEETVEIEDQDLKIETELNEVKTEIDGEAAEGIKTLEIEVRDLKNETDPSVDETETDGEVAEEIITVKIDNQDPKIETKLNEVKTEIDGEAAREIKTVKIKERDLKNETDVSVDETKTDGEAAEEIKMVEIEGQDLKNDTKINVVQTETDGEMAEEIGMVKIEDLKNETEISVVKTETDRKAEEEIKTVKNETETGVDETETGGEASEEVGTFKIEERKLENETKTSVEVMETVGDVVPVPAMKEITEQNVEIKVENQNEPSLVFSSNGTDVIDATVELSSLDCKLVLKSLDFSIDMKDVETSKETVTQTVKSEVNETIESKKPDHSLEMEQHAKDTIINIEESPTAEHENSVELEAKCSKEDDDLESGYGASLPQSPDFVHVHRSKSESHRDLLKNVAMSRCGGLSNNGPTEESFLKSLVTYEDFTKNTKLLNDPNLVVRLDGKYFNWKTACPIMMSIVLFNRGLSQDALDALNREHMPKVKKTAEAKSYTSWWSWRRPETKKPATIKDVGAVAVKIEECKEDEKEDEKEKETQMKVLFSNEKFPLEEGVLFKKTLRLSSDQIKKLDLKNGENEVVFSVTSAYQGTTQCKCHIYRWRYDDKVVISDIDGTITKSDVLGHLLPILGKDWAQSGVAQLFNKIKNNGYKLLYLSARAIGQAGITRDYLKSIKQEDLSLPEGPLLLSPTGLLNALCREVIEKKPEDFKIPCLKDIQLLFPAGSNPFYAGYGNKVNDVWSYRAVGIPMFRIFTINHRGELKHEFTQTFQTTYYNLSYLVDHMFPPFWEKVLYEEFSSFVFWRDPIEDITIDPITKKVIDNKVEKTATG